MTQFEFLAVIISIVLAFGISDILSSWGEQIRLRREIRAYHLHFAWSVLLLLAMIAAWWGLWVLRSRPEWTFPAYVMLVVPYLTLALIAYVLTPALTEGERDIKRYYYDTSRWLFSLAAVYLATWSIFSLAVLGSPFNNTADVIRHAALILMVSLAVWRNQRLHIAAVALSYLLLAAWVAVEVFTL